MRSSRRFAVVLSLVIAGLLSAPAAGLAQDHIKAETRARQLRLLAPVDGVVQQLAVHTVGGVVTPAQPLMVVVPREPSVEVEAFLENKDIGFVKDGQRAEVKVRELSAGS